MPGEGDIDADEPREPIIYATKDVGLVLIIELKSSDERGERDSARLREREDLAEWRGLAKLDPDGENSTGKGERELKLLA